MRHPVNSVYYNEMYKTCVYATLAAGEWIKYWKNGYAILLRLALFVYATFILIHIANN